MAFFLGIDGGGSKTTCVLGNESSVLASATAGASNIVRVGEDAARNSLGAAIHAVCAKARIEVSQISTVCVGAAGVSVPEVGIAIRRIIAELVTADVQLVGDMEIAMQAAFGDGPGVIVVSGTGSIAYGRNQQGRTARAGGRGFAISDEGSGHWIGRRAVQALLQAHDAGAATALRAAVLGAWKLSSIEDLVRIANASPPPDFAQLFPHVQAVAETGDAAAREVLSSAGAELAGLCHMVIRRLWNQPQRVRVAMSGGVLANSRLVRRVFQKSLRAAHPEARIVSEIIEPALGALKLARRLATKPARKVSAGEKP